MKAREKLDLGIWLAIHKSIMNYRNTKSFKFLWYNWVLLLAVCQKTWNSRKIFLSIKLCRALYAEHFGKKRFRIRSINNGVGVKILWTPECSYKDGWHIYGYFDSNTVIYWSNSKSFFTKMFSVESSTKFNRQKNFSRVSCFLANCQ